MPRKRARLPGLHSGTPQPVAPRQPVCPSCGCSAPYHSVECETATPLELLPHLAYWQGVIRDADRWLHRDDHDWEARSDGEYRALARRRLGL